MSSRLRRQHRRPTIYALQRKRMASRKDPSNLCTLRKLRRYQVLAQYRKISTPQGDTARMEAPATNETGSTTITAHRCRSPVSMRKRNSSDLWVLRKQQRYQLLARYRRISDSVDDDQDDKPAAQTDTETTETRDSNGCTFQATDTNVSHRRAIASMDLWALRKYRRFELLAHYRNIPDELDDEEDASEAEPIIGSPQSSEEDPENRGLKRRAIASMNLQALRKHRRYELLARYRNMLDSVEDIEMRAETEEEEPKPKAGKGTTGYRIQESYTSFLQKRGMMTDKLIHHRYATSVPKRNSSDMRANRRHEQRAQYKRMTDIPSYSCCPPAAQRGFGPQGDAPMSAARREPHSSRNTGEHATRRQWIAARPRNRGPPQDQNFFFPSYQRVTKSRPTWYYARASRRYPGCQRLINPKPAWYNRPACHGPSDVTLYGNAFCAGVAPSQHSNDFCCRCNGQPNRANYYNHWKRFPPQSDHRGKLNNERQRRPLSNLSSTGHLPQEKDKTTSIDSGRQREHQPTTNAQPSTPEAPGALSALTSALSSISL